MLQRFIDSWELFGSSWLYGWAAGLLLALLGTTFASRNRIFLGAAASQCSVLGIALGLVLAESLHWEAGLGQELLLKALAGLGALVAVAIAGGSNRPQEAREGRSALLFLGAGALAMLVVSGSPFGMREVERVLHSSFLGANEGDLALVGAGLALTALLFATMHRPLRLLTIDPESAKAQWSGARWLELALRIWTGLWLGLVIQGAGAAFGFAMLVLPTLTAQRLVRSLAGLFVLAPALALVIGVPAFVAAHEWDWPPAQVQIVGLAAVMGLGYLLPRPR